MQYYLLELYFNHIGTLMIYFFVCFCLISVGYIIGANGLYSSFFEYLYNPSVVTGVISSVCVTSFFYYREKKSHAQIIAPKINQVLFMFRVFHTKYLLTPLIKKDVIGGVGHCEDAFEYPLSDDINFRALYETSPSSTLLNLSTVSSSDMKKIKGLEKQKHLEMFLYVTNVEIKKLLDELKDFSYCLDKKTLSLIFDLENSEYINTYNEYTSSDCGVWTQMKSIYSDIEEHGEDAVIPSKHIFQVQYHPSSLRSDIFKLIDSKYKYFYETMHLLQIEYDRYYK